MTDQHQADKPSGAIDSIKLRNALGSFATGITVVTALGKQGQKVLHGRDAQGRMTRRGRRRQYARTTFFWEEIGSAGQDYAGGLAAGPAAAAAVL